MKYERADDGLPPARCSCDGPCHDHCDGPYVQNETRPASRSGVALISDRGSQFPGPAHVGIALWSHSGSGHTETGVALGSYGLGPDATFIPHGQISMVVALLEAARDELETIDGRPEVSALKVSRSDRLWALRKRSTARR